MPDASRLLNVRDLQVASNSTEIEIVSLVIVNAVVSAARERGSKLILPQLEGIELDAVHDPADGISRATYRSLLQSIAEQTQDPGLGLTLGEVLTDSHFHVAGPLVMSSLTARQAITWFLELRRVVLGGPAWDLTLSGDECQIGHSLHGDGNAPQLEAQLGIALAYRTALRFWGIWAQAALKVTFAFPEPSFAERFTRTFGPNVTFDAERNALVFPSMLLDYVRPEANAQFAADLASFVRERYLRSRRKLTWTDKVTHALRTASSLREVQLDALAKSWKLSERGLRRRLEEEQTTFKSIRDQVRLERASELLNSTRSSVDDIAGLVGFREPNSFRRAFRRWSGMSPSEFRARHVGAPAEQDSSQQNA
jgi:AraC-like DNA-binding protein